MLKGVEKEGLISALIQKQNQSLFGSDNLYPDIYLKADCIDGRSDKVAYLY